MAIGFSRRLDWEQGTNALTTAQKERRSAGLSVLDLTESNPTAVDIALGTDDDVRNAERDLFAAMGRAVQEPYAPRPRGLAPARQEVARYYADQGVAVDPERLLLTASSSESYAFLWKLLCDPGDTVLVPEPSYPLFEYLARLDGVRTVPYALRHDGGKRDCWQIDLDSVDEAIDRASSRVAALVAVSPNNPTGSVLTQADLQALESRAAHGRFALVVDEVFADYVTTPPPDLVSCAASRAVNALTFSLGGLSKSCGFPQMKLGWLLVGGPPALIASALPRLELIADTYLSVSAPVQAALPALFRIGRARRDAIRARIVANRRFLDGALGPASPVSALRSDGGWSAIVRLPAIMTDEAWALTLLKEDGLVVHPGYFFDLHRFTAIVLSLLPPPTRFRTAIAAIQARVNQLL